MVRATGLSPTEMFLLLLPHPAALVELVGVDNILFGSDFPTLRIKLA